ncbi:tautomerase family protein [Synechococcus elongatus IITB7]|uniref:tautomerase family protein n=1 Tax=Synechococcus elongatus TaxID=32046 RepID=UPI0030D50CBC
MPIIQVQHRRSSLNPEQKAAIATRLTELLLQMEGGAHTEGGKAFATVLFSAVDDADWWVGGRNDDRYVHSPGAFLVTVTIPEGYMNQAHKNEVHAGATAALMEVLAPRQSAPAGNSILVMINEIPEGNWGAGGHPISIAAIAETVGLDPTGDRFAWVHSYFAAKARLYSAAQFPANIGGLLPSEQE